MPDGQHRSPPPTTPTNRKSSSQLDESSTRRRIETDEVAFGRSSARFEGKSDSNSPGLKSAVIKSLALDEMMNKRQKMNCGRQVRFIWTVYRISHIDCIQQEFDIDIRFVFEWQDSLARVTMSDDEKETLWYPRLIVANKAEDDVAEPTNPRKDVSIPKDGYVRMKMRIKGKMQEIYELADFPFDTQDLQINIRSRDDFHTIGRFVPGIPNRTNSYQNLPPPEWTQHEHVVDCDLTAADLSTKGNEYAYIRLALIVKRKHMHYIQTIYSMVFFLTACGFSIFTLQVEQMGERVATNFTLLLTMVS